MTERKKRILLVNEFSGLATGYGVYGSQLLKRLHATGKYDIAELGCYLHWQNPEAKQFPWRLYGVLPDPGSPDEGPFHGNPESQFGAWRFEETVLDFKPDIVCAIRDIWMDKFIIESPLRPYYNIIYMNATDAEPPEEDWVAAYTDCDRVLSYTDWGIEVLKRYGGDKIKIGAATPPGIDMDVFKPVQNKQAYKTQLGDFFVVGTAMRNQKRKLFPHLLNAFKEFLEYCSTNKNDLLARKAILYFHTSYPDVGWDFPRLIKETGLSHKIMFTYICRHCKNVFPAFWSDVRTFCTACGRPDATLPNTTVAVSSNILASIMNFFDVYVQYACAEAAGMPQIEAGGCGVPIMSVDYAGMSDIVRKLYGTPIAVESAYREVETHRMMVIPNNTDFVQKLYQFLSKPESVRMKNGFNTRKNVEKWYTWERTAKIWEQYIDELPFKNDWDNPPNIHQPLTNLPQNLNPEQALRWGFVNVLGKPELMDGHIFLKLLKQLTFATKVAAPGGMEISEYSVIGCQPRFLPYTLQDCLNELYQMRMKINQVESVRCGLTNYIKPNWITNCKKEI